MNGNASGVALNAYSPRERNVPVHARTENDARKAVLELNAYEERTQKDEQNRRTYGRTPEGIGRSPPTTSGNISIVSASASCPMPVYLPKRPSRDLDSWTDSVLAVFTVPVSALASLQPT